MSDRIFEPTPERRRLARQEGRFPRSIDISGLVVFAAGMYLMAAYAPNLLRVLRTSLVGQLQQLSLDQQQVMSTASGGWMQLGLWFWLPFSGALVLVALLSQLGQGGWIWNPGRAVPDLARVCPRWSGTRWPQVVGLLVKLSVIVGGVAYLVRFRWVRLLTSSEGASMVDFLAAFRALATSGMLLAVALGAVVCLEYAWSLWRYHQSLKMTAEEMREVNRDRPNRMSVSQVTGVATQESS